MKRCFQPILQLTLVLVASGQIFTARSQETPSLPKTETASCVKWIGETVPGIFHLDAADFCAGIEQHLSGWHAVFKCGQPGQQIAGAPVTYCASSGDVSSGAALAAGFRSTTSDGRELLDRTPGAPAAVTFYSNTRLFMGDLQLEPGMYDLIPVPSSKGWRLEIARSEDERQPEQYLGSVAMAVVPNTEEHNYLEVGMWHWTKACSEGPPYWKSRELHLTYGSKDLLVCLRMDPSAPAAARASLSPK
jgi:hypothetical protein